MGRHSCILPQLWYIEKRVLEDPTDNKVRERLEAPITRYSHWQSVQRHIFGNPYNGMSRTKNEAENGL